jgi:hypothetical protein
VVSTAPADAATPRPAGSPWYTVQESALGDGCGLAEELGVGEEPGLAGELALGEELGLAGELALGEELGLVAVAVAAPAVPPAVIQSRVVRPASHPAVRTVRPLRIVKD